MLIVTIEQARRIRQELGLTHLVIFGVDRDGRQHVATHGDTEKQALEAADAGNLLKLHLGWPENLCAAKPLPRTCANCVYFKPDYGTHCFNGWTKDGSSGNCNAEPTPVPTHKDRGCRYFSPNV